MLKSDDLSRIRLFKNLDSKTLGHLESRCHWATYDREQKILGQLDESNDVFFLVSGKASVIVYSVAGKAVAFRDLEAGDMFGELAAIDDKPRAASVKAVETCRVASMTPVIFREVISDHPDVGEAILRHLVVQIRTLTDRVFEYSTLPVKHRIHAELLRLAKRTNACEARIEPLPTHEEIANRISTHRQAVTSEMTRLTEFGLIERDGRTLRIKDLERLVQMVHEAVGD